MSFEQWFAANFPDGNAGGDGSPWEQKAAKAMAEDAWREGQKQAVLKAVDMIAGVRNSFTGPELIESAEEHRKFFMEVLGLLVLQVTEIL